MKSHIDQKLKKSNVKDVKTSVIFKNFGQTLLALYEPIIFYNILNKRIELVLLYYGLQSLIYALSVHDGAKIMSKIGIKKSMIFATFALIAYQIFLLLFANQNITLINSFPETIIWFIILAVVCAIYQSLYWPAFHTDLSLFMKKEDSGKNISTFYFLGQISSIIGPILGGLILVKAGTTILITIAITFIFISIIPLFKGPDSTPTVSLTFKQFMSQIFNKRNRRYYIPFAAEGINSYIGGVFWTLFVFSIIGSIIDLGLLASGVSLFSAITVLLLGHFLDKNSGSKGKILKFGVTTSSLGWLIKGIPGSSLMFFVADNIQKFGNSVVRIPFEKTMYSRFKNIKSLADEYVVIREMVYHFSGALIMFLLAFIIWQFNIIYSAFIIASLSYLFYLLMK